MAAGGRALNGNQLSGTIPPELGRITALQILNLAENRLTGALSRGLFSLAPAKEWKMLILKDNLLTASCVCQ